MKTEKVSFPVVGMHCASCAKLIEKRLIKIAGVESASVNYGSEQASVEANFDICSVEDIKKAVNETGYKAVIENKGGLTPDEQKEQTKARELKILKTKVIISILFSIVIFMGAFPA